MPVTQLKTDVSSISNSECFSTVKKRLSQIILERTGIDILKQGEEKLTDAISKGMQKFSCDDLVEYSNHIEQNGVTSREMEHLISEITIGESYFYRDQAQINYIQNEWVPKQLKHKKNKSIRIWSAGCSDGQEIYTISILLAEVLDNNHDWEIQLLGTDINNNALENAKKGVYTEWSMRTTPTPIIKKYFSFSNNIYTLKESIKKNVCFQHLNLATEDFPSILNKTNYLDLIICRNVFIYFSKNKTEKILKQFKKCLNHGGVLILGATDLVNTEIHGYKTKKIQGGFIYENKREPHEKQKSKKQKTAVNQKTNFNRAIDLARAEKISDITSNKQSSKDTQPKEKTVPYLLSLANTGKHDEASKACRKIISSEPTNKDALYLYALILSEQEKHKEAHDFFKKTLFIDPHHVLAHYHLGLLLIQEKKYEKGLKHLNNAFDILKTHPNIIENQYFLDKSNNGAEDLKTKIETQIKLYTTHENVRQKP